MASVVKDMLARFFGELHQGNPDVPKSVLDTFEERVRERIAKEPAPRLALIGDTGVGKSSTINALFNAGQDVGHTRATTTIEYGVTVKIGPVNAERGELIVYDMPGLNESLATREQHLATYARVLSEVDVALWVLDAPNRAMEKVQAFMLAELRQMNPKLAERLVFALNKVDLVHPGETAWHPLACLPSEEQQRNIDARIRDVERLVREALPAWQGSVIGYSATKRYNLPQLFAVMLDAVGKKRQWVLAEHRALADYFELVDERFLPPDRKPKPAPEKQTDPAQDAQETLLNMSDEELQSLLEKRRIRATSK